MNHFLPLLASGFVILVINHFCLIYFPHKRCKWSITFRLFEKFVVEKLGRKSLFSSRGPWKSIEKLLQLLHKHKSFDIGKGDKALFWKDNWLGSQNFKTKYPVICHLSLKKEASITD